MKKKRFKQSAFKRTFDNNWFIIRNVWKLSKWYLLVPILTATTQSINVFLQHFWLLKVVIDCIQEGSSFQTILKYILFVFVLVALKYTLQALYREFLQSKECEKVFRGMRMLVYRKAVELDIANYDDPDFYNECVWSMNECANRVEKVRQTI